MHARVIRPEILDSLPEGHPDAVRNRKDIFLLGKLSGNYRHAVRLLREHHQPGDRILEIGAGTGELGKVIGRKTRRLATGLDYTGLDLWQRPHIWPQGWNWWQGDLLDFDGYSDYNVLMGNFILHQFDNPTLSSLFERIRKHYRLIIFCETARHLLHVWQLRLAYLLGINYVTRHDGKASIEAGFKAQELPSILGLQNDNWTVKDGTTCMGCYWMVARQNGV